MHSLKRLFQTAKNYQPQIKRSSFYAFLNKIFDIAPPLLIGLAVEIVVGKQENILHSFGINSQFVQLIIVSILTFFIWFFESYFEYLMNIGFRNLAQNLQNDIRMKCYRHLQTLEMGYFEDQKSGNLISIVNDDANQLERFLDVGAIEIIQLLTTIIGVGTIFFIISPEIAWLSFTPIPVIILGSFYFQKKIGPKYKEVRAKAGNIASNLNNSLLGMTSIKAYNAEEFQANNLEAVSREYAEENSKAIKLSSSFTPLIRMAILVGFLINLLYGGKLCLDGELTVGSYSVLIFMVQRLLWPLTRLGATVDLYQRSVASLNRLFSIIDTKAKLVQGNHGFDNPKEIGAISMKDVNFSYDNEHPILKEINLEIKPGETIGFVGATGSGKSTLVKLLLRFYDPQSGEITIDDKELKDLRFFDLRAAISYVGQENFLFDGPIAENIGFGSWDKSDEEILKAAKLAEVTEFAEKLPNGFKTIIGERGQKLSGGQKQRISIARALLKDAPIFIFDEATSAVDNETEAVIQRSMELMTKEKTTLIIAHRLSTVVNADKIYVLQNGSIIQSGTHEELLKHQKGVYRGLWQVQTGLEQELKAGSSQNVYDSNLQE
ncbi:MAG: ABC transporter ATP-binding protein [Bacteriovoracaceae bacterium]